MSKYDIVYEKTPLGQAIYNIYRKHGSKPSFFKKVQKGDPISLEIEREWMRLEKKKRLNLAASKTKRVDCWMVSEYCVAREHERCESPECKCVCHKITFGLDRERKV